MQAGGAAPLAQAGSVGCAVSWATVMPLAIARLFWAFWNSFRKPFSKMLVSLRLTVRLVTDVFHFEDRIVSELALNSKAPLFEVRGHQGGLHAGEAAEERLRTLVQNRVIGPESRKIGLGELLGDHIVESGELREN